VADERRDADQLDRPVAEHLIRQAQIAARCVQRVRHGMSVLLIPPLAGARVIVPQVIPFSDCLGTLWIEDEHAADETIGIRRVGWGLGAGWVEMLSWFWNGSEV
jgi:hypothetical protein